MGNFIGTYTRTLDDKCRLQLPPKLLSGYLGGKFYLLRGFEGCLSLYPESDFTLLAARLGSLDQFSPKARKLSRMILGSAEETAIDSHGRLVLRKEIADRYSLGKNLYVIGVNDHVEIWDKEAYESYLEEGESLEEAAASLLEESLHGTR